MKKYEQLYKRIRGEIESGILRDGEKLLSIREEARFSNLSINTVINAYEILMEEGLIKSLERGGFYVCKGVLEMIGGETVNPEHLSESYSSTARETGERLDQLYERLLHVDPSFASAAPGPDILPSKQLNYIASGLNRSWLEYNNPEGDYSLRKRITVVNREMDGPAAPDDIVITNGATEALTIVLKTLLKPGDKVALESPSYFNYFRQLSSMGISIVEIPAGKDGINHNILEDEIKKQKIRMIITQANVQNPTGITMNDSSKQELTAIAEKFGIFLVQDDVYGDLSFSPFRPKNLSYFSDYDGIIIISSCSKSIAPGLRVGWIRSPYYAKYFAEEKLCISMDTSHPAQSILTAYLGTKEHRRHLNMIRKVLEKRVDTHLRYLSEILPEGSVVRKPHGGCLLWIALPENIDAVKVFEKAAGKGLITAPGAIFTASRYFNNYIRLNTGFKLTDKRAEALSVLGDCKKLLK